jgi:hypothetical protein
MSERRKFVQEGSRQVMDGEPMTLELSRQIAARMVEHRRQYEEIAASFGYYSDVVKLTISFDPSGGDMFALSRRRNNVSFKNHGPDQAIVFYRTCRLLFRRVQESGRTRSLYAKYENGRTVNLCVLAELRAWTPTEDIRAEANFLLLVE